ncbi:MAG: hypothetical protein M0036_00695 [Desulfobacteraceae bacterium]|nr:hypothetical protein [Desulfobacteraceae bacterium]
MMTIRPFFWLMIIYVLLAFGSQVNAAERIFFDGFENGLDHWNMDDPGIHWQSREFVHSGLYAHKVQNSGSLGENAFLDIESPVSRKIYLSFWWLLANASDTSGKLGIFTVPGTGARMEIWWRTGSHGLAVQHSDAASASPECGAGTSRVHDTHTVIFDSRWHHFEIFIEYNTPGVDNGRLRVWIDRPTSASFADPAYLKVDHDDVLYINEDRCERYYSSLSLPENLDAGMKPGALYYDDVEIWDDLPPQPPVAPRAPTNLRIVQ